MSFFFGFGDELLKLAADAQMMQQQDLGQKKDLSPVAGAGKNLGIGTAAGQPEQPAGTPATANTGMPKLKGIPGPDSKPKLQKGPFG